VSAEHGRHFADIRPVTMMVIVASLLDPKLKIEIEAEAEASICGPVASGCL